jgi:hypothetical protein
MLLNVSGTSTIPVTMTSWVAAVSPSISIRRLAGPEMKAETVAWTGVSGAG